MKQEFGKHIYCTVQYSRVAAPASFPTRSQHAADTAVIPGQATANGVKSVSLCSPDRGQGAASIVWTPIESRFDSSKHFNL
jgi:hypothetical protein